MSLQDQYRTIQSDPFPEEMTITLGETRLVYKKRTFLVEGEEKGLRYGENPDQPAALYQLAESHLEDVLGGAWRSPEHAMVSAMQGGQMLQAGKHPGKTNLTDVDNGANILQYLTERPAALILKHNNPSGAAWSKNGLTDALEKAYWGDRIAAYGGAVVVNRPLDKASAEFLAENFFEVVAAPEFEEGCLDILGKRKSLRVLHLPTLAQLDVWRGIPFLDVKSLCDGGIIVQRSFIDRIQSPADFIPASATTKDGQSTTTRKPTPQEAEDLFFAWAVEAGVSSNSVIFARDGATVSIGTGEQDRVGCVELAAHKAYTKYADTLAFRRHKLSLYELTEKARQDPAYATFLTEIDEETKAARAGLPGTVLVSDGFFPFRDGVDVAMREGVTAIAQPGGSIRDFEVLEACNQATPQVAMVFTGQRSFKH